MRQSHRTALALVAAASSISSSSAFSTGRLLSSVHQHQINHASTLFAEEASSEGYGGSAATAPIEKGSHDELMFALGVNLARQLGDVRPLVENSEELTQLARGLLDTVIGRLDDEDQRELLGRRGDDLNNIILERA